MIYNRLEAIQVQHVGGISMDSLRCLEHEGNRDLEMDSQRLCSARGKESAKTNSGLVLERKLLDPIAAFAIPAAKSFRAVRSVAWTRAA